MKSIIVTAVHTGMRRNESPGAQVVRRRPGRPHRITVHEGKWGSARHVPINSVLARAFEVIPRHVESPYVFYHREKGRERWTSLYRAQAGLEESFEGGVDRQPSLSRPPAHLRVMARDERRAASDGAADPRAQIFCDDFAICAHGAEELRNEAAERLCEVADGHFLDTSTTPRRVLRGTALQPPEPQGILVRAVGIEPTTHGLKNRCSPAELRPRHQGANSSVLGVHRESRRNSLRRIQVGAGCPVESAGYPAGTGFFQLSVPSIHRYARWPARLLPMSRPAPRKFRSAGPQPGGAP